MSTEIDKMALTRPIQSDEIDINENRPNKETYFCKIFE